MSFTKLDAIDKNFRIETGVQKQDIRFYNARESVFRTYGVFWQDGAYRRMPEAVARSINKGVYGLHTNTAGGRIRFVTDSSYVAIRTSFTPCRKPHFPLTGSSGFDLYTGTGADCRYAGTFVPPVEVKDGYESVLEFADKQTRLVTINFPLYSDVQQLEIGLQQDALLQRAPDYRIETPVVYYGSSITQGACASRPGNCYPSLLSRRLDCNYLNLGFSGSAKGEIAMGDYLKQLDMSVFVLDYDHNAPNLEKLQATHGRLFRQVRDANPTLPIIILPRPRYYHRDQDAQRFEAIRQTYLQAKAQGDENVYFITNRQLMEYVRDDGLVDNTHPTDSGFFNMAQALQPLLEQLLQNQ